jgi:hypothetical protein
MAIQFEIEGVPDGTIAGTIPVRVRFGLAIVPSARDRES